MLFPYQPLLCIFLTRLTGHLWLYYKITRDKFPFIFSAIKGISLFRLLLNSPSLRTRNLNPAIPLLPLFSAQYLH